MNMWTIYCITNTKNNKKYVGQTHKSEAQRFAEHVHNALSESCGCPRLYNAMRKYGNESFIVETLSCVPTLEEANAEEMLWIEKLNTTNHALGYNVAYGGSGVMKGRKHSDESKNLISEKNSGRKLTPEQKSTRSRNLTGHVVSKETRAKISKANKGKVRSQDVRDKISEFMKTRPHTESWRQKTSAALKGRQRPDDVRQKISDAKRGKKCQALKGEGNGSAKLTNEDVIEIKRMLSRKVRVVDIMQRYNVSKGAIANIKTGRSWSHVMIPIDECHELGDD